MKKNIILAILTIASIVLLSGCADVSTVCAVPTEHIYGFWGGLWHGWIAPISFVGSLISDDIAVYAINNTGGWYDFGFVLGIGGFTYGAKSQF